MAAARAEPPLNHGSPDSDGRTVLLAIAGDEAAFETLVSQHQQWLFSLLWRQCGEAALAADLTQAAFLRAWRQIGSLRSHEAFRAWLRRIAQNLLVDAARRRSSAAGQAPDVPDHPAAQSSFEAEIVARVDLERALARLRFHQRSCLVLAYGEGLSHAEIAELLALPLGTVKSHIARGLAALRADMDEGTTHGRS